VQTLLLASSDQVLYIWFGLGHGKTNVTANIETISGLLVAHPLPLAKASWPPWGSTGPRSVEKVQCRQSSASSQQISVQQQQFSNCSKTARRSSAVDGQIEGRKDVPGSHCVREQYHSPQLVFTFRFLISKRRIFVDS